METHQWLRKYYSDSAPSIGTVERWFREFRCGRTGTEDAARSGRPNEAVVPENIKKIHRIILNDRKVKVRELAEAVSISKGSVETILHEHLGVKKLVGRWVPRFLTINQKQQRIMDSEHCLELFRRNPSEFLRRFITMDETWIHHYTPQSNKQSAEWLEAGQSRPKRPKTQQSAGKVLASIFWDACGVIFIDYLEKGKTVTGEYYASLLDRLNDETKKKRPNLAKKKVLFHQDNEPVHKSTIVMAKLHELHYELLPHPPYSPVSKLEEMASGKEISIK